MNELAIYQYGAIAAGVLAAVLLALLIYNRRERRRYRAAAVAAELEKWGLGKLAAVFRAYAVGDYSGLVRAVEHLYERIAGANGGGVLEILGDLFWKLLSHYLSDAESRKKIRDQLEAAETVALKRASSVVPAVAAVAAKAP